MNDEIFEKIKSFVIEQRWDYSFLLERTTKIEKDLRITGDDAVEFIFAFSKQFNVDVSNFMMTEYFEPEGDKLAGAIIRMFTGKKKAKNKELLLGDLERAVEAGKLDNTVIESAKV
jgi:acyl carrier protein